MRSSIEFERRSSDVMVQSRQIEELDLPHPDPDLGISDEWHLFCRQLAYRFYIHALNERFPRLDELAAVAREGFKMANEKIDPADIDDQSLGALGLDQRLLTVCEKIGVFTLGELAATSDSILLSQDNVQERTIQIIRGFVEYKRAEVRQ